MADCTPLNIIEDGGAILGFVSSLSDPDVVEVLASTFGFVWLDGQHGRHTVDSVAAAVRRCALADCLSLARTPGQEYGVIGRYLDTGVDGIIVPMVESVEEARAVVAASRFPPVGNRSCGGRRAALRFGQRYMTADPALVIVQIESPGGLSNVEAIVGTEGISGVLLGNSDLGIRLGLPSSSHALSSPEMSRILSDVAAAARSAGKLCGCLVSDQETMAQALEAGCQLITYGSDEGFLRAGALPNLMPWRDLTRFQLQS
jgi:4-hydroxy-2-oxoheptanedioate aldolase